jgi:hypothetical protein
MYHGVCPTGAPGDGAFNGLCGGGGDALESVLQYLNPNSPTKSTTRVAPTPAKKMPAIRPLLLVFLPFAERLAETGRAAEDSDEVGVGSAAGAWAVAGAGA